MHWGRVCTPELLYMYMTMICAAMITHTHTAHISETCYMYIDAHWYRALTMIYNPVGHKPWFLKCHHIACSSKTPVSCAISAIPVFNYRIFIYLFLLLHASLYNNKKIALPVMEAELCSTYRMAVKCTRRVYAYALVHKHGAAAEMYDHCIARRPLPDLRLKVSSFVTSSHGSKDKRSQYCLYRSAL